MVHPVKVSEFFSSHVQVNIFLYARRHKVANFRNCDIESVQGKLLFNFNYVITYPKFRITKMMKYMLCFKKVDSC